MSRIETLRTMFTEHFGSAPCHLVELGNELGGSARRMIRISNGSSTAIGVVYAVSEENRAFIEFSRHFCRLGLPVPEIYAADLDRDVYLEEDLGDLTLYDFLDTHRSGPEIGAEVLDAYRSVVRWLPRFQVDGGRDLDYGVCYPRPSFDDQSIRWDLNYFKYCFLRPAGIPFNEQALEDDFQRLTEFLLAAERGYFLYRDFQSRNVMLKDGQPRFIDYQGGRRGALQYDVASLLYDAKADLPPAIRDELLEVYLEAASAHVDRLRFMEHFYGYAYIRIMQALGAYGLLGLVQRKQLFLDSIPYALQNVRWLVGQVELPVELPELMTTFRRMIDAEHLARP